MHQKENFHWQLHYDTSYCLGVGCTIINSYVTFIRAIALVFAGDSARSVMSFTIRDSPFSYINMSMWGKPDSLRQVSASFSIGSIGKQGYAETDSLFMHPPCPHSTARYYFVRRAAGSAVLNNRPKVLLHKKIQYWVVLLLHGAVLDQKSKPERINLLIDTFLPIFWSFRQLKAENISQ